MSMSIAARLSPSRAVVWGLVLVAPAALFLLANILNELGIGFLYALIEPVTGSPGRLRLFNIVSPMVFLGGSAVALALNLLAIATLDVRWVRNRLVSTVTVEARTPNLALILAGGLMLAAFVAYGFVENYKIIQTHI
jgi:xanthosine utilization system XapX-like protein